MIAANTNNQDEDYIQYGLVFHLDCANYNPTLNTWVDKKGGVSFATSNVTVDSLGGVVFNGTNSKGVASVSLNYPVDTSTIEVAIYVRASKSQFVLESGGSNTIMYGFHNTTANCLCSMSTNKNYNKIPISTGFIANSVHYGSSPANIVNGNIGSFASSGTYWSKSGSVAYLGSRSTGTYGNFYLNGIIYQIRIYNRLLTTDEMIHNHQIDMNKYDQN